MNSTSKTFSTLESEVMILLAITDVIDSIVNREVLDIGHESVTEARFKTYTHAKYFNLVLVDLLSGTDKDAPVEQRPYLQALAGICEAPHFDVIGSIQPLREAHAAFTSWLNTEIVINGMWLPSINLALPLRVKRIEVLKIAGNICKHNTLRSMQTVRSFQKVLRANKVEIAIERVMLVMEEVYQWFHRDKFIAQSNALCEFLNSIRWGVHDYLRPEFERSMVRHSDGIGYHYTYPLGIQSEYAQTCYWGLMNWIRSRPFLHRFKVRDVWKSGIDDLEIEKADPLR